MANAADAIGRRGAGRGVAPLVLAAALFLLAAVLLSLPHPAGGPQPWRLPAAAADLAGAALIAFHFLRRPASATSAAPTAETLVRALAEPAALVDETGAVEAANDAWREAVGAHRRLQRSPLGGAHALLRAAARDGAAEAPCAIDGASRRLQAGRLGDGRFLVRLGGAPAAPAPTTASQPKTPAIDAPARLDAFAAASPFGAALIEGEDAFAGQILEVNGAWAGIAGDAAAPGASLGPVIAPAGRAEAARRLADGGVGPFEVVPEAAPDRVAHLYITRLGGRCVAYLVDVTEQKQLQAQLAQSNKMQAIGQLAGGVAHDFNNLLSGLMMNLTELETRHPLGDPSHEGLSRIRSIAVRATSLVGQLLTYSRKVTVQRAALDVGEVIGNVTFMLGRLLPENVKLDIDYGRDLPQVLAGRQQLENALMNLVVNARDALQSQGGGVIKARAARVSEEEAAGLGYGGAPVGQMALIEVADNGPGIPPDVLAKIFEPFFTTKPIGEGTGLGLSTVYGIVKQFDGWTAVESKPGEGAAFRIFLPVYEPPLLVEPPAPAPPKGRTSARDLSGVGRILFVEDEESVRRIAARLLRARGYEVLEASDGDEALAIAQENAGQLDLMISDVMMPGLDGPGLLKAARPYLGEAPVMFISGYAEADFSKVLEGEPGVSFLPKPIDIPILAERVKQLLQGE